MATDVIRLVSGDNRPAVLVTLTDDTTRGPVDLSDPATDVFVRFRAAGTKDVLSIIPCFKIGDGSSGQVMFSFAGGVLDVPAGSYEGEVQVNFSGELQTVFEVIRFRIRENF